MEKIWINPGGGDKIIAFIDNVLYKVNPPDDQVAGIARDLENRIIPKEKTFGLPLVYIKEVRWQEGLPYIQFFFQGSEEHYRVTDDTVRAEIFAFCKTVVKRSRYEVEANGGLWAAKKPLIAFAVVLSLAMLSENARRGMARGDEFEYRGVLAGLALLIASLGIVKEVLIFGSLAGIALFAAVKKMRNPPVLHRIRVFSQSRLEFH